MAIEPKSPRKRAVKKISKRKAAAAESVAAISDVSTTEVIESKLKKKAPAIPVPIFQSATTDKVAKAAPKTAAKKVSKTVAKDDKKELKSEPKVGGKSEALDEGSDESNPRQYFYFVSQQMHTLLLLFYAYLDLLCKQYYVTL